MTTAVVITTINKPTTAIKRISSMCADNNWLFIVVGDRKTPSDWHYRGVDYLDVETQASCYPELSRALPFNHYCRKNIGYLHALRMGATSIIETDDDNVPYKTFGSSDVKGRNVRQISNSTWVNVYRYFGEETKKIWPRGNPLDEVESTGDCKIVETSSTSYPVIQWLADRDPDVDAIYRLLDQSETFFDNELPLTLSAKSYCSFNSQNTLFEKAYIPSMYLPCEVSFRMTDIWRSFVVQRVLHSYHSQLLFNGPTVEQFRNEHNLMRDFEDEIVGYQNNRLIVEKLINTEIPDTATMFERLHICWKAIHALELVTSNELTIFNVWEEQVCKYL